MSRAVLVTLHFDGGRFAGWQRQARGRTVQAEIEKVLARLTGQTIKVHAAGRTDAGVHAIGMAVSTVVPDRWVPNELRRALNALLPEDCWAAECREMKTGFHARKCASSRRYRYVIGTDEAARSPFRRRYEWALGEPVDAGLLAGAANRILGEHDFTAFSVRSSPRHHKRCRIVRAEWEARPGSSGYKFEIQADRFLHHMVRMLVGTMVDVGLKRRATEDIDRLLKSEEGIRTSPPAPPEGLYFVEAEYPREWFA